MALAAGTKLGPYEIQSPLGAGGMGEVYRARDTRLDRTVAIKILPGHFCSDPGLKQRFEREARAISSFSHPNICHLYDVGIQDGTDFLVMEYLEGETLAHRLVKGPLPLTQLLKISIEIADALNKAHRHGVVHRDLKPGNIMLTKSGAKLMDFGLAKTTANTAALAVDASAAPLTPSSPTAPIVSLTVKASPLTQKGTIVGTFQYMAPEVLQGEEADARSDLFSFGCVLYEMITARPAFKGKTQLSVLAAILEQEPEPVTSIQPTSPAALDWVVRACLTKDRDHRLQSAHDLKLQLELVREVGATTAAPAAGRKVAPIALSVVLAIGILAGAIWSILPKTQTTPVPLMQLSVALSPGMRIAPVTGPVISPDASAVVFVARTPDSLDALYLRRLDSPVMRRLEHTEMATYPFWSPDSASVGFFADGQLKRLDIATAVVQPLANAADGRGATWNKDGIIIFCPRANAPLFRVSASGGPAQQLTDLNGNDSHRWPSFLPDGQRFVYTAQAGSGLSGIFLASLSDPRGRRLTSDAVNGQVVNGFLLFTRGTTIVAAKLDLEKAALGAENTAVAGGVKVMPDRNFGAFSVADNGTIAYAPGDAIGMRLAWFDRTGRQIEALNAADVRGELDLSHDGHLLVSDHTNPDGHRGVQVLDLRRGAAPVARVLKRADSPIFSPAGESIAYGSNDLVRKWIDGSEREQVLAKSSVASYPDDWSRDGRWLLFERVDPQTNFDLMLLDLHSQGEPQVYLRTPANEAHARISPDGRWVAYASDESGRPEVYVQSFPTVGSGKWQISTQGGDQPYWRADNQELYFITPGLDLMSVPIRPGKSFAPGVPTKLFTTRAVFSGITGARNYYVAASDGKRFLVQDMPEQAGEGSIGVVLNWQHKMNSSADALTR